MYRRRSGVHCVWRAPEGLEPATAREVVGVDLDDLPAVLGLEPLESDALTLSGLGFSWGGFESLAIHCDPQLKIRPDKPRFEGPVVCLHVGLEDPDDLIAGLRQALDAYVA